MRGRPPFPFSERGSMGERIYIDRDWTYAGEFSADMVFHPMTGGEKVSLPHSTAITPLHYFVEHIYQKVAGYQRIIFGEEAFAGKDVYITFEGAAHEATVYLNGKELFVHRNGYTAFTILLSDLKIGEDNLLTVKLDSRESLNQPPFGFVIDYMTYGGLYRDVYLTVKNPVHMDSLFYKPIFTVAPDTSSITKKGLSELTLPATLATEIDLSEEAKKAASGRKVSVRQYLNGNLISDQPLEKDGKTRTICGNVRVWDVADPFLYKVRTELLCDGEVVDSDETELGFRTAEFRADGFFLNGRYLKLRGLNRHQSYPYAGYAMPESMQRYDAYILKEELGLNAVRTSHYPQSQDFISECDRRGLLVFTEIPGWQHIGDRTWKDIAVENVTEMVTQYRNHPSIILWGVRINESADDDEFYERTNAVAHAADPTRPTGGVRCHKKMSFLEDVYTYNDFSHSGNNPGCEPKKNVTPDVSRPYLISEYNGHMFPTKSYDPEEHVLSHTLRHARVLDTVMENPDIAGSFGWCMFDYNTHKDFGSGDRICYHGVLDMFRNPKGAAYVYAAQAQRSPVLYITSSMDIGEHPASVRGDIYIITNADSVRMYKNDHLIKEYFPTDSPYKSLKHGPIPVDDLIGDVMLEREGFSKRQNELVKACLNETAIHGYGVTPRLAAMAAQLMTLYHMKISDATDLYQKYIGDWGGKASVYRFDAVKNGRVVKSVTKTPMTRMHMEAEQSAEGLTEGRTYDVMEVRVKACDEYGNVLPFMNDALKISCDGPVELIGPHITSFSGGMTGFYVKSAGIEGKARITLSTENCPEMVLELPVTVVQDENNVKQKLSSEPASTADSLDTDSPAEQAEEEA